MEQNYTRFKKNTVPEGSNRGVALPRQMSRGQLYIVQRNQVCREGQAGARVN